MNEFNEGRESSRFPTQQIFRTSLIYGLIGLAFWPLSYFFSSLSLLVPVLICAAQFIDIRTRPKEEKGYIRVAAGLIIYVIIIQVHPVIFFWLFDFGTVLSFVIWFIPFVLGTLVLGATFPSAEFSKADGSRSALFWVLAAALFLGAISWVLLGLLFVFAIKSGI